ncbi:MAG: DNA primase [Candidatus Spechtbacterales bacterium]|nr:DNA primase [Candidatus Spechtbacterales bacterium]
MPQDPVEEIKNRLDIKEVVGDYIRLEKSGINYKALCPFHKEKTPSFFVSPTRQMWRCFGCGVGGDMFTFIEQIEGSDFPEALKLLAKKAGVEIKRMDPKIYSEKNKSLEICELTAKFFNYQLESKNGKLIKQYLKKRGITKDSIDIFKLGYAPVNSKGLIKFLKDKGYSYSDMEKAGIVFKLQSSGRYVGRYGGRIIFPISNTAGHIVGFGARKLTEDLAKKMERELKEDSAKYINTPQTNIYDKSKILYGLDKAKIAIRQNDRCIVVEGYTDVILAHQNGYQNVVASSGTALTQYQLNLIQRFTDNLYTCFDMDAAGDMATRRGIDLAQNIGFDVRIIALNGGKDPAEVIAEDKKGWEGAVKNAKSITQFYFDSAIAQHDKTTPEGKRKIAAQLTPIIANIPSKIEQSHWVQELADKLNVDQDSVWKDVENAKKQEGSKNNDIEDSPQNKKRAINKKEALEREIVMYVLKSPANLKTLDKYKISTSESDILGIIDVLREVNDTTKLLNKLDSKKRELVEGILFEAEVFAREWSVDEFTVILGNYKKVLLDEELQELEQQIKEIENRGEEEKTKELLDIFNKKARQRAELN